MKKLIHSILVAAFLLVGAPGAQAQEPFIGEITWFAGNFAPRGWAFCDGQLLPIAQNQALFAILGTTYGGDGRTTFALPDVRGRVVLHEGQGPGLSNRQLGSRGGSESVTLTAQQLPAHTHQLNASGGSANTNNPSGSVLASPGRTRLYDEDGIATTGMNSASISTTGNNQPHNNMMPFNTLNCIIALQGVFPSRN